MNDLDYTITKNRLEILLLKAQEDIKGGKPSPSKVEAIEVLQNALKLIYEMRHIIDEMNRKHTEISLQNVKAYRQTAELKKKLNVLNNG